MITVRRSDTGSFVLVHEPSQTVMVGDELEATFARMEEQLRADPSLSSARPPSPAPVTRRGAWWVGAGILALLPFLWLTVLHYTLGRLLDDLRAPPAATSEPEALQTLRAEVEALRQVVSRVEDEAGQARRGELQVGRAGQARRPLEQRAAEPGAGEDDGDGEDEDEGEGEGGPSDATEESGGP